jgi:hypothetical protein
MGKCGGSNMTTIISAGMNRQRFDRQPDRTLKSTHVRDERVLIIVRISYRTPDVDPTTGIRAES